MPIRRISSAAVFGLAVLFAGCDGAPNLTSPQTAFGTPQFSFASTLLAVDGGPITLGDGGVKPGPGGGGTTLGGLGGIGAILPTTFAIVDGKAVTLNAGRNSLVISAGAMPRGTVVTMAVNPRNRFEISFTATSKKSTVLNDVGAAGFSKPVTLYVYHGPAAPPSFFGIALRLPTGLVPVPSRIQGNYVVGELPHFSTFVVARQSDYSMAE
jgi:hypothetical protein